MSWENEDCSVGKVLAMYAWRTELSFLPCTLVSAVPEFAGGLGAGWEIDRSLRLLVNQSRQSVSSRLIEEILSPKGGGGEEWKEDVEEEEEEEEERERRRQQRHIGFHVYTHGQCTCYWGNSVTQARVHTWTWTMHMLLRGSIFGDDLHRFKGWDDFHTWKSCSLDSVKTRGGPGPTSSCKLLPSRREWG